MANVINALHFVKNGFFYCLLLFCMPQRGGSAQCFGPYPHRRDQLLHQVLAFLPCATTTAGSIVGRRQVRIWGELSHCRGASQRLGGRRGRPTPMARSGFNSSHSSLTEKYQEMCVKDGIVCNFVSGFSKIGMAKIHALGIGDAIQ